MTALWNSITTNKMGFLVNSALHLSLLPSLQRFSHLTPLIKWTGFTPYTTYNQAFVVVGITEGVRIISNTGLNYLAERFKKRLEQLGLKDEQERRILAAYLTSLVLLSICFYSSSEHGKNILAKSLAHRVTSITTTLIEESFLLATYAYIFNCCYLVHRKYNQ